ncbi:MAG: TolC family protein [Candidatus Omnitrophica bacterium]|nr:TolC family protein [Candidatus Omnitrophota bacterium]
MKKIFLILLILFVSIASFSQEKSIKVLPLEDFVNLASQNDTRFEEILIDELKLKYQKTLSLPTGDFLLSIKGQYDFLFNPSDNDYENKISLSKLFPYTGTTLAAEYDSSVSSRARNVSSEFNITFSQPIAQNAFGRNTRLLSKIIGLETEVARFQITEAYEDYLASIIQLYYNWYSAYENVKTAQNSLNENLKLLDNTKERQKHKIALPVDVNKVELQVAAKKEALIALENAYAKYLNLIKESIRHNATEALEPTNPSVYEEVAIDFDSDYELFKTQSRTIQILNLLQNKGGLEINQYADEILPSINIIAGYSKEGSDRDLRDSDQMAFAGLSFDWPFPSTVERARLEIAKINLEKTKLSNENIYLRLHSNLKNLNNQIANERQLIVLAKSKIIFAQSIVEDERKNYSLGRTTLKDFIDEVNKLEDNKFNKLYHEIELKRLIVEWLRLTDNLLTKTL